MTVVERATASRLVEEAVRVIGEAERHALTLRAFGGVGLLLRLGDTSLLAKLDRDPVRDIDLVGVSEQRAAYRKFFDVLDYEVDRDLLIAAEGKRYSFQRRGDPPFEVDLFIDRLAMCHTLELRSRLSLHPHTIPLADILLQKLQIVDLTRKDVVDVAAILSAHDLGAEGAELVDAGYICRLLADDWGFYHTVVLNLARIEESVGDFALDAVRRGAIRERLQRLRDRIEAEPKSRRWKLRARIGTKMKWYQDVGEGTEAF